MNSSSAGTNLRDYFAGIALEQILDSVDAITDGSDVLLIARQAYLIADAMLIARDSPDTDIGAVEVVEVETIG